MTFGPAVGGFLAVRSYRWLFIADGGTCWLAAAVLGLSGWKGRARGTGWRARAGATRPASPWKDGAYLALLGVMILFAVLLFQIFSTWPLTLRDLYGFGEERIGLLLGINTLVIVLFEMILVHRLAGANPLRVAAIGCLLFGVGMGLTPAGSGLAAGFAFIVATVLVWTVGEMLALPMVEGFIAGRAGEGGSGRYMALLSIAFSIAFILAPVSGTWAYERFGARVLWGACAVLGVAMWACLQSLSGAADSPAPVGKRVEADAGGE
jgi:MFS family permease